MMPLVSIENYRKKLIKSRVKMKLKLRRVARNNTYTIGKLYIDDKYFCDTIEDKDRGLN
jgi:hypothetical protein